MEKVNGKTVVIPEFPVDVIVDDLISVSNENGAFSIPFTRNFLLNLYRANLDANPVAILSITGHAADGGIGTMPGGAPNAMILKIKPDHLRNLAIYFLEVAAVLDGGAN